MVYLIKDVFYNLNMKSLRSIRVTDNLSQIISTHINVIPRLSLLLYVKTT